jgi:RND family efflux transporter MFP subunit
MAARLSAKVAVPLGILALGVAGAAAMIATRPVVTATPTETAAPLVRALRVAPESLRYAVRANGTVAPRTQSDLVPQVSGEVVWISPSLASGGFFDAGEPLLRIDPRDYEVDLESGRAALARAESEFARSRTERGRQRELAERSVASQARIDDAENAYRVGEAQVREARASLERAERDLDRTELRAPFQGRVREKSVDVGQFVNRGAPIAKLYAVDIAEVRLPVPDRELSFLDLDLGLRRAPNGTPPNAPADGGSAIKGGEISGKGAETSEKGAEVLLHADFAGKQRTWHGRIVRTEGEIDPRSRMVHVVARVEEPYAADPPLAVGLFVSAEIFGRTVESAYVLPRAALQQRPEGDLVFVIDAYDRLRFRPVTVLRVQQGDVVIGEGLAPGERVSISPLGAAVDGMRVRVIEEPPKSVSVPEAAP